MGTEMSNEKSLDREAIRAMRRSYGEVGMSEESFPLDPAVAFHNWLRDASENSYIIEPNAMVLSTLTVRGPQSRTVLLKDFTDEGFTFFTNYDSRKSQAIAEDNRVSLLFPWYAMERQVLVNGIAEKVPAHESDDYFAVRPWGSQIGAWASAQSSDLADRATLENKYKEFAAKFPEGSTVPRPPHWGGFAVTPTSIEFWQGRQSRLHDRFLFKKDEATGSWLRQRLYP
jgi:pyridoxamine 5'-phosphate oxidase